MLHEMAHLLKSTHNTRFTSLLDCFLPKWKHHEHSLNQRPVRHERWGY